MQITDPIADLLTRVRNANNARHETVEVPASKIKMAICRILLDEGYVKNVEYVEDGIQGKIVITLKYGVGKTRILQGLKRISKPGLRIYSGCADMPKVMKGMGTVIVSTSKGVMTDKEARKLNVGGEVLAFIW